MQPKTKIHRLAVVGSRDFTDYDRLRETIRSFPQVKIVVSGGAKGADKLAEKAADELGLVCEVHRADWKRFGKGAGPVRNTAIVESAEAVLAFLMPGSRGTLDTLRKAQKKGLPLWVVRMTEEGVEEYEGEWPEEP